MSKYCNHVNGCVMCDIELCNGKEKQIIRNDYPYCAFCGAKMNEANDGTYQRRINKKMNGKALERLVKTGLEITVRLDCEKNFLVDCKDMYASDGIFEKSFAGYGSTIEEAAEDYIAKFQGEKMYVKDEKGVKRVLVL